MAAPTINLSVPTPSAGRMAPSVVNANIGIGQHGINIRTTGYSWTQNGATNEYYTVLDPLGDEVFNLHVYERVTQQSLVNATYKWTASSGGTSEYFLELAAGGDPGLWPFAWRSTRWAVRFNGSSVSNLDVGELAASRWGWGLNPLDSGVLTVPTLYVRLAGSIDPNAQADGYVDATYDKEYTEGSAAGSLNAGEWFYDSSTNRLYVRLRDDTDPDGKADGYLRLDYDLSSTGTSVGEDWELCEVRWTLTGTGLATWPSKYRYVTDHRHPQQRLIDLSTEAVGYSLSLILTEGDWTITCTVTNADGEETEVSSATITVAANTRTQYVVNSAGGGDYTSLQAAITARGADDNVEYLLADGHAETRTASFTTITGDNAWVHADDGDTATFTMSNITLFVTVGTIGHIYQNFTIASSAVGTSGAVVNARGTFLGIHGITVGGAIAGNRVGYFAFYDSGNQYTSIQACEVTVTRNYSIVGQSGANAWDMTAVGNTLGPSTDESIVRTVGGCHRFTLIFNWLDNTGVASKSTYRAVSSNWHYVYGNRETDGDTWFGSVTGAGNQYGMRYEANLRGGALAAGFHEYGRRMAYINNVSDLDVANAITGDPSLDAPTWDGLIACNTNRAGNTTDNVRNIILWRHLSASPVANLHTKGWKLLANLNAIPVQMPNDTSVTGQFIIGDLAYELIDDNVWMNPSQYDGAGTRLGAVYSSGAAISVITLANWNAKSYVGTDQVVDTTIDDDTFVPSPATVVDTPRGVFRDFWGNPRGTTSNAGAVEDEPLTILTISPDSGAQGTAIAVTITGLSFTSGTTITFSGTGLEVTDKVVAIDGESMDFTLTIAADATPGLRDATVSRDGISHTLTDAFEVLAGGGGGGGRGMILLLGQKKR